MTHDREPARERTLDQDIPELHDFLQPGMKILDIGCGDGDITMGVAETVRTGEIIGIDPDEETLVIANQRRPFADNIEFRVGDSHALDFADDTFDLVYSHTVVHFFLDPVSALKEQRRVTKPGGLVIVSGVREMVYSMRFPACPNWDKTREARRRLNEMRLNAFQSSGMDPIAYLQQQREDNPVYNMSYGDDHAGKKCAGWLAAAGLVDIQIRVKPERIQYSGSEFMEPSDWDLLPVDVPKSPWERQIAQDINVMIGEDLLDATTVTAARQEAASWYSDPHAFFCNILVFAVGRVP